MAAAFRVESSERARNLGRTTARSIPFPCDMTHRRLFALAALLALLLGAGCGDRGAPTIAEMDEPFYIQGVQLNKQGRNGEALTTFLKVIDKRGERGAPESHLEAGVIYLSHTK